MMVNLIMKEGYSDKYQAGASLCLCSDSETSGPL